MLSVTGKIFIVHTLSFQFLTKHQKLLVLISPPTIKSTNFCPIGQFSWLVQSPFRHRYHKLSDQQEDNATTLWFPSLLLLSAAFSKKTTKNKRSPHLTVCGVGIVKKESARKKQLIALRLNEHPLWGEQCDVLLCHWGPRATNHTERSFQGSWGRYLLSSTLHCPLPPRTSCGWVDRATKSICLTESKSHRKSFRT